MVFQTKSKKHGIHEYSSLKEALAASETDESIRDIFFTLPNGEVVMLMRTYDNEWVYGRVD